MSESFVYRWLPTHAVFDVICFPAFVRASRSVSTVNWLIADLISNIFTYNRQLVQLHSFVNS